ncbi:NAD-dependent epimerase/dehydratase family protein [Microbacterium sp. VKM Ac-2870]|uniref:NAD-dependent epimerase/dehydratase family protein n=1 Tax=Microbacterium sp. VKM Ac-2870 TaxID=2783825 RepID=UPI00188C73F9|nr:NAD-dependent epimerase/dehydratase family protein [Microbacterium sp. VKM Ac-2870]MBF4561452.1 NAD-dependent epimerase/dehydratase family protein [Microbacterium sp. VKM Ac-2870]
MKAIVTGGAGFVGSRLAAVLAERGHDVLAVDCFTDYYDRSIKERNVDRLTSVGAKFLDADLLKADLQSLLADASLIFHQAGQPGVRSSWGREFAHYLDANISLTQKILEAVKSSDTLSRFVYASSSSVYGDAESFPTSEDSLTRPVSPYGVSKLAAEHLCSLYARNFGVPTISLRYFTVYGPGQRPDMAFTRFTRAAVTGGEIDVYGDGNQVRDFTYIDDIVEANIAAALAPDIHPGTVLNVAGGSSTTIRDALELLRPWSSRGFTVRFHPTVSGDVYRTGGDTSRIRAMLGWYPKVSLEDGLKAQFAWAQQSFSEGKA